MREVLRRVEMLLRKVVFLEGAGRGEGSVFDVYFTYLLHTHLEHIAKTMSYDYQSELAPHSTDTRPVRRTPHRATHYTQPFPESLADCCKSPSGLFS